MFYQIFLSPKVKRWAIITYKHGLCELPYELPNNLRLTILLTIFNSTAFSPMEGGGSVPTQDKKKTYDLRKLGSVGKVSKPHRTIA